MRGWSVGMLKVQRYSSIFSPGVSAGTRKAVMPLAAPGSPLVRAKTQQWLAVCMPVVHIFAPSMRQPAWPLRVSRTAVVSMWVASEPCSGSVRPKVMRIFRASEPRMNFSFCAGVPKSRSITISGKLPTTECSFCKSLNSPRPCEARWSRITDIHRLLPPSPPNSLGSEKRKNPASSASFLACSSKASHSGRGRPPLSKSVRAHSRRWSKKRSLSSCACSGLILAVMKASSLAR